MHALSPCYYTIKYIIRKCTLTIARSRMEFPSTESVHRQSTQILQYKSHSPVDAEYNDFFLSILILLIIILTLCSAYHWCICVISIYCTVSIDSDNPRLVCVAQLGMKWTWTLLSVTMPWLMPGYGLAKVHHLCKNWSMSYLGFPNPGPDPGYVKGGGGRVADITRK